MSVSRDEVIWGFRMFFGRDPESKQVIDHHARIADRDALRNVLINSDEFSNVWKHLKYGEKSHWVCAAVYHQKYLMWLDLADKYVSGACLEDNYEPLESAFIVRNSKSGNHALDIGANIGWHTLGLANAVGETGSVNCFEPRLPTGEYLQKTIVQNQLAGTVKVNQFGLWDVQKQAMLEWEENTPNPGGSFVVDGQDAPTGQQTISLRRIDDMELPVVDFIKIDIEGAEFKAFVGGKEMLARSRPLILSELHPQQLEAVSNVSSEEYIGFMKQFGYECFLLEPGRLGERISRYPDNLDRELTNVVFAQKNHKVVYP